MNKNIVKLARSTSALDAIHQGLIRCGFELEFQSVDGVDDTGDERESDECNDDDESETYTVYPKDIIQERNVEVVNDSSVDGGEARTCGALTPSQFMQAAKALFGGYEFDIDEGCSFHIHLSVPTVRHKYGKILQAEMMSYLLTHTDRMPKSVRERLANDDTREYFKFELDQDKYRAVHYHNQGTWEFRLFGNISNRHDAYRCLLLAIEALRHGYRAALGLDQPLAPPEFVAGKFSILTEVAETQSSLPEVMRARRLASQAIGA